MLRIFKRSARDKNSNVLYFGIELELASPLMFDEIRALVTEDIEVEDDCSINMEGTDCISDAELQFQPGTWLWWLENRLTISRLLKQLRDAGSVSGNDVACGLHVHFSNVLGDLHTTNVMQFIYSHEKEMLRLSRRTARAMDQYSHFSLASTERPVDPQCCRVCQMSYEAQLAKWISSNVREREAGRLDYLSCCSGHYQAVNVGQEGQTVEVRIFAGTLYVDEFYYSLEFVHAVIEYTRPERGYDYHTDCDMYKFNSWLSTTDLSLLKPIVGKVIGGKYV
jgi:hypothetical protein